VSPARDDAMAGAVQDFTRAAIPAETLWQ